MTSIVIAIDKDIPLPDGNPRAHSFAVLGPQLRNLAVGDSFFMGRATLNDVAGLLRFAERLGIKLKAFEVDDDEVYLLPGVRIWRVSDEASNPGQGSGVVSEHRTAAEQQKLGLSVDVVKLCRDHGAEHLRFHLGRFSLDRLKLIAQSAQVDPSTAFQVSADRDYVINLLVEHAKQALLPGLAETSAPDFNKSLIECTESPFDPVQYARTHHKDDLRKALSDCTWAQLHRMLDEFGLDPGKLVRNWLDKPKVESAIFDQVISRAAKRNAAKSTSEPAVSQYWRLADGTCFRFKSPVTSPKKGATPITREEWVAWDAEQEL